MIIGSNLYIKAYLENHHMYLLFIVQISKSFYPLEGRDTFFPVIQELWKIMIQICVICVLGGTIVATQVNNDP